MMDQGVFCEPYGLAEQFRELARNFSLIGNIGDATDVPNCFRPGKDIVLPQYEPNFVVSEEPLTVTRPHQAFFKGQIVPGLDCSPHVREYLQQLPQFVQGDDRYLYGSGQMREAYFGFTPAGWACWSARLYDALTSLTIPVIMANPIIEPFERFLDWRLFTTKVNSDKVLPTQLGKNETWFMDIIQQHVQSFEEMLARGESNSTNYIVKKRAAMREVLPWLQWKPEVTPYNAWGLMVVELWCRTRKGSSHPRCQVPPSTLAFVEYW